MSSTEIVLLTIKASVMLNVLAIGFTTTFEDCAYLLRHPRLLLRSLLAMNVVMFAFAFAMISIFELPAPVEISIVALSLCPVLPLFPKKLTNVSGSLPYGISLLVLASLASVVLIPASVALLASYFGNEYEVPMRQVIEVTLTMLLVPLAAGIILRKFAPRFIGRIAHPAQLVATLLLIVSVLPLLLFLLRSLWAMTGTGAVASLALFSIVGLAVGHMLGGPDPEDRTVLALATSARHPGIAVSVAALNSPDPKTVLWVVLAHLVVSAVVSIPYNNWRKRHHAAPAAL